MRQGQIGSRSLRSPDFDLGAAFHDYLEKARAGHGDAAFFGMLHLGADALPLIEEAYRNESDAGTRSFLIEIAWQTRNAAALPLLQRAMDDPDIGVWIQATDGLVVLGTPEAAKVLRAVKADDPQRATGKDYTFGEWIDEALEQFDDRIGG